MNSTLSSAIRAETSRLAEYVATNPMENDSKTEREVAINQHRALVEYARRPDGLQARLDRDRRAELTPMVHSGKSRWLFRMAHAASLGLYTHREEHRLDLQPMLQAQRTETGRKSFLRDVLKSGSHIDVTWDLDRVRNSLRDAAASTSISRDTLADMSFNIFSKTGDAATRQLCLETLNQIGTNIAREKLLQIAQDSTVDAKWRMLSTTYLGLSNEVQVAGNAPAAADTPLHPLAVEEE
jgi:hypothetical protein